MTVVQSGSALHSGGAENRQRVFRRACFQPVVEDRSADEERRLPWTVPRSKRAEVLPFFGSAFHAVGFGQLVDRLDPGDDVDREPLVVVPGPDRFPGAQIGARRLSFELERGATEHFRHRRGREMRAARDARPPRSPGIGGCEPAPLVPGTGRHRLSNADLVHGLYRTEAARPPGSKLGRSQSEGASMGKAPEPRCRLASIHDAELGSSLARRRSSCLPLPSPIRSRSAIGAVTRSACSWLSSLVRSLAHER